MEIKLNKLYIGVVLGLILPIIAVFVLYKTKFYYLTPEEFYKQLLDLGVHLKVISLAVVPNLLIFFVFIWINYLQSAKGVLLATFIYAFAVFGLKLFF